MNEKVSPAIVYCYMLEISSFPSLWKKPGLYPYIFQCLDLLTAAKESIPNTVSESLADAKNITRIHHCR